MPLVYAVVVAIKTDSMGRKLSNFNFQWTKILYHNYLKHIAFFFTLFSGYGCNWLSANTKQNFLWEPKKMKMSTAQVVETSVTVNNN